MIWYKAVYKHKTLLWYSYLLKLFDKNKNFIINEENFWLLQKWIVLSPNHIPFFFFS